MKSNFETSTAEKLEVMEAAVRGEPIQARFLVNGIQWVDCSNPVWNWEVCEFRVKPKCELGSTAQAIEDFLRSDFLAHRGIALIESRRWADNRIMSFSEIHNLLIEWEASNENH